jgi:hypothetical protein
MNPYLFPSAQTRVPIRNIVSGITRPDDDAIRPNVTIPFEKAWPDDPRIAKAVMFVPKRENRKTNGPNERFARKYSSACSLLDAFRKAKIPM